MGCRVVEAERGVDPASDETTAGAPSLNGALLVVAIAGWLVVIVSVVRLQTRSRELLRVRSALHARAEDPIEVAVVEALETADDRVAQAESMQHWLLGALDESSDAIIVIDRLGREVVRNASARRFEGARHGEVLAEDALRELLRDALDGGPAEREMQLYGPPRQSLHLRAFALRSEGEVVGAVGFSRDVTESRRVESVRRDFVANVSHELKTPIGALALLAETMAASDDMVVMLRLAERVVREADRLAQIVDDLLDLSLIEAQESPTREPLPVPVLVNDAAEVVRTAAETAGVPLNVTPRPPDVDLECDHRQLRSALVNLLDNAIKYSEPGQAVDVGACVEGDRVALIVRDHGIGIPTRDLERIFERFYRVDRARSRETGGTGLGLSIVRHVAQAHGGEVTVTSREGEGSTFTLFIPLANGGPRALWEAS
ncbi:MAG: ATP-binding protein [Actinomycetota bacterium]|nr:ATP-binding protein [Actinomycetota bacterium]